MSQTETQDADHAAAGAAATTQMVQDAAANARQGVVEAADAARDVAGQAKQTGAAVAGQLKDQAIAGFEAGKASLADKLEDVAAAAQKSGQQLEGHQDFMAQMIERGASELASVAGSLRQNDLNELIGTIRDLGQRQPALFTGLAVAAGFALVRIGKLAVAGASREDLPKMPAAADE